MVSNQTLNEATFGIVRQHGEAGNPALESPNISITGGVAGFGVEFWHPIDFTQNNFQFTRHPDDEPRPALVPHRRRAAARA